MKVLFINTLYSPYIVGGAERSTQLLAEALVQKGHRISVVCSIPNVDSHTAWVNGVKVHYWGSGKHSIRLPSCPGTEGRRLLRRFLDVYSPLGYHLVDTVLEKERPDLVHTHNLTGFSAAAWRVAKARGIPVVHTLRDHYLLCPRSTMYHRGKNCQGQCVLCRLFTIPRKLLSRRIDAVVGISRYILDLHRRSGYFSRSTVQRVIYNSVTGGKSGPPRDGSARLRFGFMGRLQKKKGFFMVADALQEIAQDSWELYVAGDLAELGEKRPLGENIHYLGFVPPAEFFRRIDVLVVPSLWQEPLGRTVLEAYACGIPVIGSDRGGIPEIIDHGVTGLIYPAEDRHALRRCAEGFIQNPALAPSMGKDCLKKAEGFSSHRIASQYLDLYGLMESPGKDL